MGMVSQKPPLGLSSRVPPGHRTDSQMLVQEQSRCHLGISGQALCRGACQCVYPPGSTLGQWSALTTQNMHSSLLFPLYLTARPFRSLEAMAGPVHPSVRPCKQTSVLQPCSSAGMS